MKIGHVHLKVKDLGRSARFYEEFLDMKERERIGNRFIFLSGTDVHHEVALQEVGEGAKSPGRYDVGLFHTAFEVPDRKALALAYKKLKDNDIPVLAVDHRISWAIYFFDPDGNGLEIYWDARNQKDGTLLWEGRDRPLSEAKLLSFLKD
jgi:catechol 2,3-dioxygenase